MRWREPRTNGWDWRSCAKSLRSRKDASARQSPPFQPLEKFDRIAPRKGHSARLGDGILDFDDEAPQKSKRLLILDGEAKAGIGIR